MDWDAADARDVVQALATHFGFGFAEAVDFLLARQLQQAQNDDGEAQLHQQPQDDDEEEVAEAEQSEDGEEEDDGAIVPMLGQELVTVSATVGSGEWGFQDQPPPLLLFLLPHMLQVKIIYLVLEEYSHTVLQLCSAASLHAYKRDTHDNLTSFTSMVDGRQLAAHD